MPHSANINTFAQTAIVVDSDGMGQGDTVLRQRLIATYFQTLFESHQHPMAILVYGAGVQLLTKESPCFRELVALHEAGVPIIACRTCLDHYGLMDHVAVGEIGNMLRIMESQGAARKVINL